MKQDKTNVYNDWSQCKTPGYTLVLIVLYYYLVLLLTNIYCILQYPDVYNALCLYVTTGKTFAPISLFAFNLHTQKRFMCCIMPYSDPDVTWGNNPHLMEDLDLTVTL